MVSAKDEDFEEEDEWLQFEIGAERLLERIRQDPEAARQFLQDVGVIDALRTQREERQIFVGIE